MVTPNQRAQTLASLIGIPSLILKREDLHPLGSHKGRSIPVMIEHYVAEGASRFAISSSGNAALAAIRYLAIRPRVKADASPLHLTIYVGKHINKKKLAVLTKEAAENSHISIEQVERPLQSLIVASKEGAVSLRQSTDNTALTGYSHLAEELCAIPDLEAVFIGSSSGTTAEALGTYFAEHDIPAQIHIVQTPDCHPIFDTVQNIKSIGGQDTTNHSLADAIVDHVGHRKDHVTRIVLESNGSASIATNEEILVAQQRTKEAEGIEISTNSALSVAGLMQQKRAGRMWSGTVVCLICGL